MKIHSKKMHLSDTRLARRLRNLSVELPFNFRLPDGDTLSVGIGESAFTIGIKNQQTLRAVMGFDQMRIVEAYIQGDLEIEGEMWDVVRAREVFRDTHPFFHIWKQLQPLFTGQHWVNKKAINHHYEYDSEYFLSFLDKSRCYSQALYEQADEPLETAQRRKLDFIVESCNLKPGDRVLDVGGGWGTFVEFAGEKGIHVTALTLARKSEQYINQLIKKRKLTCKVEFMDFYEYTAPEPYDAIVILGVMEHLPNYRRVLKQFHRLLRPGGRVYLDASSCRKRHTNSTFISRYVFPGNHRFFCLHDFLSYAAQTNLEIKSIHNDRYSYYLTCRAWAKNLEAKHEEIAERWGEELYRIFRIYLWGSSYGFYDGSLDAYRMVLERPEVRT